MEEQMTLDTQEGISKIDTQNVLGSVDALGEQCIDAWEQASRVDLPVSYSDFDSLIMCGMGGSGLGARIIESAYFDELSVPLVRVNDYNLPRFVNENTLVICTSYSGTTEETMENAKEAIEKKAKWIAIGTGNTLIELAKENDVPFYKIDPSKNPSNQPRMAVGYLLIGQLVLLAKLGLISIERDLIDKASQVMRNVQLENSASIPFNDNPAKQLAMKLKDKIVMFVSSEHLIGATHTVNNQFNENAKNLTFDVSIPEANHHLMEGLKNPSKNPENLFVFFANSDLYGERIKKRFEITKEVLTKHNIGFFEFKPSVPDKLSQVFELIQFGAYVNFYLSILYNQDPSPIPTVDYFKERLGQPLGK